MDKSRSTPDLRAEYKAALSRALLAGYEVLNSGGEAMDAVVAAVSSMEGAYLQCLLWLWLPGLQWNCCPFYVPSLPNFRRLISSADCPLFNCGRGAVFNTAGKVSGMFDLRTATQSYVPLRMSWRRR